MDEQTGDLKSTYSIFNEISKYWDKMSNSEKQALAIQYAGKNQFEVFMATESQMTDVQKAYTLAVDDNNMATKENERYMESLSAKLQALKAQFEEFVLGDGSLSVVIKLFVDLGTAVLKFANSDLGKLELKFVAIGAVVLTLVESFSKLKAMMNMSASIATIKTLFGLIETEGVGAIMALSTAEKASILLTGISAVVAGVYLLQKAFDYFNTTQEELIEDANNLSSEWETATNKAEELKTKISSIDEQIESLKSKGYITLTEQSQIEMLEQERDLLQQQEEIQETLANMAKVKMQGAIDKALTSKSDYDVYNAGSIQGTENGNLFQQVNSEVESYQKATQALNDYTREYNELLQKKESGQKLSYNEQQTLSQLEGKIDEATEKQSKYSDAVSENSNTIMEMYQALTDAGIPLSEMSPELQDAISSLDSMSYAMSDNAERITDEKSLLDELSGALGEQVDSVDEFIDKAGISGEKAEEIKEAFDEGNYLQAYALACQNATEDLSGLADGEDELTESTEEAVSALEEQLSAITTLYNSYGTLQQAVADFNTNGYIDPSNLKELLSLGDEYINLLQMQDGQLSVNEAGFEALANAQYDKAEADAYEEYTQKMTALAQAEAKGTLDELQTATNSYSTEPMNAQLKNLVQNLGLAVDGFNDLAVASAKVNIKTDKGKNLAKQYSSSLQTQLTFIEAGRKGIGKHTASIKSNTKATGSNTSSRKSNTGSTKSNTDAQKANTEALKKNVEALKKQKEAIEKEKEDMEKVISYIKDKVNDYIDELEDAKGAETDLIDDALNGLDDIKDALDDAFNEDKIDKLNKIMDKSVKKLDELNAELQKLHSEGKNTTGVEKEIEALNKSLEIQKQIIQYKQNAENAQKEEERIENEINRLKEENDELEQQLEYKQLLDNLAKAQQTRLKVYKEGQGFVYTQDQSAISEAQKALDEWLRKKKLDDQIKQLEDQRDRQKKIYDQQVENLDNLKDDCDELYDQMNKDLEEYKNQVEKRWDDQINYYKNWLKSFENGINEYENQQNRLLALEKTGIDFEQQGWQTRLSNLSSFVESYKAKLAELEEATRRLNEAQQAYEQAQAQASASGVSSGGGGGGGSSSGSSGYNPSPTPAQTATRTPVKITPFAGQVFSYNSGLSYRFLEGSDKSWHTTTTAWQHGFKVQKVFSNGDAYVRTKSGKLALVRASEWNVAKVRRSNNKNAYASGASSIQDDQMALVGDSPTNNELVIGSKLNGQFMNLKKGSGVVNATSTNTLAGLLNQLPKLTRHSINATTNNNTSSNDTVFSIGNITIDGANITDITSFKNALINIKSEAIQRAYQH